MHKNTDLDLTYFLIPRKIHPKGNQIKIGNSLDVYTKHTSFIITELLSFENRLFKDILYKINLPNPHQLGRMGVILGNFT